MYLLNVLRLLLLFATTLACTGGCENSRSSQRGDGGGPVDASLPDSGAPPSGDAGPRAPAHTQVVRCTAAVKAPAGLLPLEHVVSLGGDGSTTARCAAGRASASASYRFGQTGQQGAVCFVELDVDAPTGGYFRFTFVGAAALSIVTYLDTASTLEPREWTLPCAAERPL
jgi:hypothetical protein